MRFCIDRRQCLGNCASPGDHTEEGTNIVPKLKIIYSLSTDTGKLCNSLKLLTSDQLSGSTHARLPEMGRVNQSEDCVFVVWGREGRDRSSVANLPSMPDASNINV